MFSNFSNGIECDRGMVLIRRGMGDGNNTIDFELTQNERVNRIRADTSLIIEKVSSSYKFKKPGF